jgi:small neutral amino acid transporter SnatA (MarC family)
MLAFVELFGWVADLVGLDLKAMKPAARVIAVVFWGFFGLLFLGSGFVPLFDREADSVKILGGLLVSAVGAAFLGRIAYGLIELRRISRERTDAV